MCEPYFAFFRCVSRLHIFKQRAGTPASVSSFPARSRRPCPPASHAPTGQPGFPVPPAELTELARTFQFPSWYEPSSACATLSTSPVSSSCCPRESQQVTPSRFSWRFNNSFGLLDLLEPADPFEPVWPFGPERVCRTRPSLRAFRHRQDSGGKPCLLRHPRSALRRAPRLEVQGTSLTLERFDSRKLCSCEPQEFVLDEDT